MPAQPGNYCWIGDLRFVGRSDRCDACFCDRVQIMRTASNSSWWRAAIPAFVWLRSYQRAWVQLDLVAGVTLAAYLLSAALGDASLANLPPQAGLYACLFAGVIFWIFWGSRFTAVFVYFALFVVIWLSLLGGLRGGRVPCSLVRAAHCPFGGA